MKAVYRSSYVSPEDVTCSEIEQASIGDKEILIKVHATTVNRTDVAVLTGKPYIMRLFIGLFRPSKKVPGTDLAGEVLEVGSKVSRFKIGDKVWGFNDEGLGSQAQVVAVKDNKYIDHMPKGLNYEEAVAGLEGGHYALNMLRVIDLKPEHRVLINGATGAIGSALIQFVSAMGCQITATADTANLTRIKDLGASRVYDYTSEDFTSDPDSYDFIFDSVGKSSFGACKKIMKPNSIYISSELGKGAQNIWLSIIKKIYGKKRVIFPVPGDVPRSMKESKEHLENGSFKPLIDRRYPIEQVSEAYCYTKAGFKTGNVILLPQA